MQQPLDLEYTHERLYRTVSGLVEADEPIALRLKSARLMLSVLETNDFPASLRPDFEGIMGAQIGCSEDHDWDTARLLCKLFLQVSKEVVNCGSLPDAFDTPAWAIAQHKEGRCQPLLRLIEAYEKRGRLPPPEVRDYVQERLSGTSPKKRRGRSSIQPNVTLSPAVCEIG